MFWLMIGFAGGLLVGWNLPQPAWAKALWDRVMKRIKGPA